MRHTFQQDLTRGSVARHLIRFSIPFLAANFLQALYNMADMFFVGRYTGPVGATAVGVGGQLTFLMIQLISGLAVGGTVLIAQQIGAKRQDQLPITVGTIFTLYGVAGIALTVLMLLLNPFILKPLVGDSDSLAYAETLRYVQICTGGLFFIFGYNAVSAVLRGMGDSKHPLWFVSIAAVLNVLLDWLLCGPLHMGAAGAAWATVLAQGVSFLLSVFFLRRQNFVFDFHPRSFRIHKATALQLLKIGVPTSIGGTAITFSFMALTGVANTISALAGTTAISITSKVCSVAFLPALAMQAAVSSMAGQNLGAGKHARALQTTLTAIGISMLITVPLMLLTRRFAEPIVYLFIGSNTKLSPSLTQSCVDATVVYLKSMSWDYLLISAVFCIVGLAMAAGHTKFSLVASLISSLVVRLPAAFLLGITWGYGLRGMGFAAPIATSVSLVIDVLYVLGGFWKKSQLTAATREALPGAPVHPAEPA